MVNWKDAPKWAKYLAKNSNDNWCWYENEPKVDYNYDSLGWDESLQKRPEA